MNTSPNNTLSNDTDLKSVLQTYTRHWKWFVLSALTAMVLAFLYIRYTVPQYSAEAKIQILEDKGSSSGLDVFQDLGLVSGGENKIEDEIQIIKSRSNVIEVVKQLGLNMKIYIMGNIKSSEMYHNPPIKINFIAADSTIYNSNFEFFITLSSENSFGYAESTDQPLKVVSYGKNLTTAIGDILITPNMMNYKDYEGERLKIVIQSLDNTVLQYQNKIMVSAAEKGSNILNISLQDPVQEKAKDILDALVDTYNRNDVEDRKAVADITSDFINDRITEIYSDLAVEDQNEQDYKSDRGITDVASQANVNLTVSASSRQELENATLQLNIASSMRDLVENQDGFEMLPSNIGLSDQSIASTTAKYNELVAERNRLLKSSNEKNPIIVNLDQELRGLKQSMESSLGSMTNNLGLQVNSLSNQLSNVNSRLYAAPKNQRALRDIGRKQQTTESLYLYLLQKREESQITFASATPKSKIIDRAYGSSGVPVSPKKPIIFLASLILGLMLPFSVIYAKDLLDNKIHNKLGLEKLVGDIPVLAELPKLSKKDNRLILKDDRSVMAESLRILRTNLDYLIKSKNAPGKKNVIYITSSVSGEGKTFLSSNLAMILANTQKKVLLIGADIRNPKLSTFFNSKYVDELKQSNNNYGLTEYLYDDSLAPNDLVHSMLVHTNTIDVVHSGKIPPNPSELLMSSRLKGLFEEFSKTYDYVIVDTAPLFVVTDTLLISPYADHIIYVTRAGVTDKKVLDFPLKLKEEGKLNGLSFVVNDVKASDLGYGGKYGYGYGKSLKKWWKF